MRFVEQKSSRKQTFFFIKVHETLSLFEMMYEKCVEQAFTQ